jgi:hypothetical protein
MNKWGGEILKKLLFSSFFKIAKEPFIFCLIKMF